MSGYPCIARLSLLCLVVTGLLAGCSHLSQPADEGYATGHKVSPLASLRMAPDIVALEIAVVTLDGPALERFQGIWSQADLQSLSLPVRQRLDLNGIRTAVLGTQLPKELTAALAWKQPLMTRDGDILFNSRDPLPPHDAPETQSLGKIEQLNAGDQQWVPCSGTQPHLEWQVQTADTIRSGNCELAQCGFLVSQVPVGDQAIKLWLRPVIRHGEIKLRYGIDQATLLMQEAQKELKLEELDFAQPLRLGQTLVVTCNPTPSGVGELYFASARFKTARQVLLIRPVQMGRDDLFAPENTSRRLSTNLD